MTRVLLLIVALWYWTNGINGIALQTRSDELAGAQAIVLFLWVTAFQLLVGSLLGFAILRRCKPDDQPMPSSTIPSLLLVALLHASGSLFTNLGFLFGSASLVQSIRLIEPFQTFLLDKCFLYQESDSRQLNMEVLGSMIVTMSAVALLFYHQNPSLVAGSFAVMSGMALSAQRVLLCKDRKTKDINFPADNVYTSVHQFTYLSWYSFLLLLVPCIATLPFSLHNVTSSIYAILNVKVVLWHPLCHVLSLFALSWTSTFAHALLDAGNRMTAIGMAILWFQEPVTVPRMIGLALAGLGAVWYAVESRAFRGKTSARLPKRMTLSLGVLSIFAAQWIIGIVPTMQTFKGNYKSQDLVVSPVQNEITPQKTAGHLLFPTTIPTGQHNAILGRKLRKEMRMMTNQALKESKVRCDACKFLIPNKLIQDILLGKPPRQDRLSFFASKYRNKKVIHLNRKGPYKDHFFQLVASFLTRTIPVLNAKWHAEFVAFASSFGFAVYVTHGNRDLRLCGSTTWNRNQKIPLEPAECSSVSAADFDSGLADWNFDTALRHFSIHQYAALQMQNKSTQIMARQLDGRNVLEVKVCADGTVVNGGDLFGPEVVRHILSSRGQSNVSVAIGDSKVRTPQIAVVGSILDEHSNAILNWGTGIIKDKPLTSRNLPSGEILAVRGPRSRELILKYFGINHMVIGDPALLARDMISRLRSEEPNIPEESKKDLCFVIHEVDRPYMKEKCPWCMDRLVDNHIREPISILFELEKCRRVVSSSLHGIIFSHALGIPAVAIKLGDRVFGGDHKFRDHMHAVGVYSFQERLHISDRFQKGIIANEEWSEMVDNATQPIFPIPTLQFYETFPEVNLVSSLRQACFFDVGFDIVCDEHMLQVELANILFALCKKANVSARFMDQMFQCEAPRCQPQSIDEQLRTTLWVKIVVGRSKSDTYQPGTFVIWNLDQPTSEKESKRFSNALEVWEFSKEATSIRALEGTPNRLLPFLYHADGFSNSKEELGNSTSLALSAATMRQEQNERDLDVCLLGSHSERRTALIESLKTSNITVFYSRDETVWGESKHELLRRCKIALNVHYYERSDQEVLRILEGVAHGAFVVSEAATVSTSNDVLLESKMIRFVPYNETIDGLINSMTLEVKKQLMILRSASGERLLDMRQDAKRLLSDWTDRGAKALQIESDHLLGKIVESSSHHGDFRSLCKYLESRFEVTQ